MRRVLLALGILLFAGAPRAAAEPPELVKARTLYNAANFDGAIEAASTVQSAEWVDAAQLVVARSHLERYRRTSEPNDLASGRQALTTVRVTSLMPRDQVDLLVGLGQSLYFTGEFGAAAGLFDSALAQGFLLNRQDRLQLLDWWAHAVERAAQARPGDRRGALFEQLLTRMEDELRRDAGNPIANYWLAVAARGAGDPERAWDAAVAAWVRSRLSADGVDMLRSDLDQLVTQGIIPERVRVRREPPDSARAMREQWDLIKEQWK